jgi:hypothetical protein
MPIDIVKFWRSMKLVEMCSGSEVASDDLHLDTDALIRMENFTDDYH